MNNKTILFILLLATAACAEKEKTPELLTPLEKSNYSELTLNKDLMQFLEKAAENSNIIHLSTEFTSEKGKTIPLVEIKDTLNPASAERLNIFIFAQQHGNEPSGKEGLLLLIKEFYQGKHSELLKDFNLIILPQVNPDGGDKNLRRNANDIDLNRDHLLLRAKESRIVHEVSKRYKPEVVVDIHEYYPYGKNWKKFGYYRNFDIQLGSVTNTNIAESLSDFFYHSAFPEIKHKVESANFSFFEYTLGSLAEKERLRRSTVDINDGRQSHGITNVLAFIIEGKRGKDSIDLLKRRAESQLITCVGILETASAHKHKIKQIVSKAQNNLLAAKNKTTAIRLEHFKGDKALKYPLLSIKTGKDTTFTVEEYHSRVKSLLEVEVPKAYLIPKTDSLLVNWLKRSFFKFSDYSFRESDTIYAYKLLAVEKSFDEGLENYYPKVKKEEVSALKEDYFLVKTQQIYRNKIVTALEPQAMYGLINYPEFEYLLSRKYFSILRLEYATENQTQK